MYCMNCGAKAASNSQFCSGCGAKIEIIEENNGQDVSKTVSIPVHMKKGLFKTEPYIILVDQSKIALIYIGKERYNNIVASGKNGGGYFKAVFGMMNAFSIYAQSLYAMSIQKTVEENPGSIVFENQQVHKFKIYNEYNSGTEQYEDFETFELHVAKEKFKGTLDLGAVSNKCFLKEVFGKRFK